VQIFRHIAQKSLAIRQYACGISRQSAEKSDNAPYAQALSVLPIETEIKTTLGELGITYRGVLHMTNSHHGVPESKRSVRIMQKKIFAWAMSMAVAAMITCTGCAQNNNSSGTDSGSSTAQTTTLDDNDTAEAAVGQSLSAIQSGEAGVTTDED